MMKTIILTACIAFASLSLVSAKAKIPICLPCESIETVQELPTDSEIQKLAGQKVNLSYANKEYGIFGMSIWNSNGRFVLSDISNNMYFEIDPQVAKILKEKHDFDAETAENPLSFWKKVGGKLVFLVIIALLIWASIPSKNKTKDVEPTNI